MPSHYTDDLNKRIREAAHRPLGEHQSRQQKYAVLEEVTQHPRAAADSVPSIVSMIEQSGRPDTAMELVEPFWDTATVDIRTKGLDALEAVASVRPMAIGYPSVIQALLSSIDRSPPAVQRRVFHLFGQCSSHIQPETFAATLIPEIERYVSGDDCHAETTPAAVEMVGSFVAANGSLHDECVDLLQRAFFTDLPPVQAAAAKAAGSTLTAKSAPITKLKSLLQHAVTEPQTDVQIGAAIGGCRALAGCHASRLVGESILDRVIQDIHPLVVADVVGEFAQLLREGDVTHARALAANALRIIAREDPSQATDLTDTLATALTDDHVRVRRNSVRALDEIATVDPTAVEDCITPLAKTLEDPTPSCPPRSS